MFKERDAESLEVFRQKGDGILIFMTIRSLWLMQRWTEGGKGWSGENRKRLLQGFQGRHFFLSSYYVSDTIKYFPYMIHLSYPQPSYQGINIFIFQIKKWEAQEFINILSKTTQPKWQKQGLTKVYTVEYFSSPGRPSWPARIFPTEVPQAL